MSETKSQVPEVVVDVAAPEVPAVPEVPAGMSTKHKIIILVAVAGILVLLYSAHKRIQGLEKRNEEVTKMLKSVGAKHKA